MEVYCDECLVFRRLQFIATHSHSRSPPSAAVGGGLLGLPVWVEKRAKAVPHLVVLGLHLVARALAPLGHHEAQRALKHERLRAVRHAHGREFCCRRLLEAIEVRSMRRHHAVQAAAAGGESLLLRLVISEDEAHELGHRVAMVVRGAECVLLHRPSRGKNNKVANGDARLVAGAREHREDRRVRVVKGGRVDDHEVGEVVLEWRVVAVPRDDVEGTVVHARLKEVVLVLVHDAEVARALLIPRRGRQKIARVRKTVGADGALVGDAEVARIHLADVAARRAVDRHGEPDSALHDANLVRADLHDAVFGDDRELAGLRNDEEIPVRVLQGLVNHRRIARVDVHGEPVAHGGVAGAGKRGDALHKVDGAVRRRNVEGVPAHLVGVGSAPGPVRDKVARVREGLKGRVAHRGADAVEPRALVPVNRDCEGSA
eukprot:Opistho-1_new@77441